MAERRIMPEDMRTRQRLEAAAAACAHDGARLTPLRREILSLILEAKSPVGAYDLLDRLREMGRSAAPPTVYRVLDFLLEHGFVHRLERLNAFVSCPDAGHHAHPAQFLICGRCGTVQELEDAAISESIAQAAGKRGFHPARATIEVEGMCATCAAA